MEERAVRRQLLFGVTATLFSTVVIIAIAEGAARLALPSVNLLGIDQRLFAPVGEADYANRPNFIGIAFGVEVRIDADGFRADGLPTPTDVAARSVVFVGDSVTFGVGVRGRDTFVARFAAAVPDVRVTNAAVIGYSLEDYLAAVRRLLDSQAPRPDHVFLGFCLNDLSPSSKAAIRASVLAEVEAQQDTGVVARLNAFLRERSKLYLLIKSWLIDTSRSYFLADAVVYEDPAAIERALEPIGRMRELLDARGVGFTVLLFPYEYQMRDGAPADVWRPQSLLARGLEHENVEFVDLSRALAREGTASEGFLFNDPMHLSERGHEVVAAALLARWHRSRDSASPR